MTPEALVARAREDVVGVQSDRSYRYDWAQLRSKRLLTSISPDSVAGIGYTGTRYPMWCAGQPELFNGR